MKLKQILFILLIVLLVIATGATLMGEFSSMISFAPKENVSMAVVGDVMFARNMEGVLSMDSSPFEGVSDVTSNVDLLLLNFENAATTSEDVMKGDIPFKCNPSYVPLAKANNNTIAALANNHIFDYGIGGMEDTVRYMNESGITTMGVGKNASEAHQAVTQEINGRKITILNYMDSNSFTEYDYDVMPYAKESSPGYSAYDSEDAKKQISEHNDSDLVVVYLHYGHEYNHSPDEVQEKIAHELIDYGADVVIGNHPHVPQGIEMYNGKPIFYSVGDFIFDLEIEETLSDYFVKIELVNDTGICTVYPVRLVNFLPQHMDYESGNEMLRDLSPLTNELEIYNGVGKLTFNLTEDK